MNKLTQLLQSIQALDIKHQLASQVSMMDAGNNSIVFTNKLGTFFGAGIVMIGAMGAAIGQGFIGGKAQEALSRNPEVSAQLFKQYIISAAICESTAIYCLIISILLIFVAGR